MGDTAFGFVPRNFLWASVAAPGIPILVEIQSPLPRRPAVGGIADAE